VSNSTNIQHIARAASAAAWLLLSAAAAHAQALIGTVAAVEPPHSEAAGTLALGRDVVIGQRVATGDDAIVQLLLADGSTITLGPRTELTIERYHYDAETRSGVLAIATTRGIVRLVGGRASKTEPIVIETPSATVALRGGIGFVALDATSGATEASLAYGSSLAATSRSTAETRRTTRTGVTLTVRAGEDIQAERGDFAKLDAALAPPGDAPASTGPDDGAMRALADVNSARPSTTGLPPTAIERLAGIGALTGPLVARAAQTIALGRVSNDRPLAVPGAQTFVVGPGANGQLTLTPVATGASSTSTVGLASATGSFTTASFSSFSGAVNFDLGGFAINGTFFKNPSGVEPFQCVNGVCTIGRTGTFQARR
jgi:hypothetical protein